MLAIERLTCRHEPQLLDFRLQEDQIRFVGTVEEFLLGNEAGVHKYVALLEGKVFAFFKLDLNYAGKHDFCPQGALGLRALALDQAYQGRGVGTRLMQALPDFIAEHYRQFHSVFLTVNCKNPAAIRCYEKAGFDDTGMLYLGGTQGPQHIMRTAIVDCRGDQSSV